MCIYMCIYIYYTLYFFLNNFFIILNSIRLIKYVLKLINIHRYINSSFARVNIAKLTKRGTWEEKDSAENISDIGKRSFVNCHGTKNILGRFRSKLQGLSSEQHLNY